MAAKKEEEEETEDEIDYDFKIEQLNEAMDHLQQAIELIEEAVEGTEIKKRAESYILGSLKMSLNDEHEYVGSSQNIEEMITDLEKLRDGEELDEDEEEEDEEEEEEEEKEEDDEK